MELLIFEIKIEAEPEKVWTVLWSDLSYRQWTSAHTNGSFYEGTLEQNSTVRFLDKDNNGMYSTVLKNDPNKEMIFLHLGEIVNGGEVQMEWENATETYRLEETDDSTILRCEVNTSEEFKDFFEKNYPKALQIVKSLSENQL
ncbi:ATPase [Chryseobacterium sp. Leaf180]|uniref:ATPase n=1 Tax=Chryseobacterium sp. Leaf180 TaxID=1736289 RepID=UPI0006FCAAE7|nr:ATPase [Chryseobacterium sp. Leaf180]KQR91510.1 ATPase [Chryseobacterium sp. Leaf180]